MLKLLRVPRLVTLALRTLA